jgi:hypothetical protein
MRIASALLLAWFGFGCSDSHPQPGDAEPAQPPGGNRRTKPTLELEYAPNAEVKWHHRTIPIHGRGTPGAQVLHFRSTAMRPEMPLDIPANGAFCLDVPLVLGRNEIQLQVQLGPEPEQWSAVLRLMVHRDDGTAEAAAATPSGAEAAQPVWRDLLAGAPVDVTPGMTVDPPESLALITDGKVEPAVRLTDALYRRNWVRLRLNEPTPIEQFQIRSDPNCPLQQYMLLASEVERPEQPNLGGSWRRLRKVEGGSGFEEFAPEILVLAPRWVALLFLTSDCGDRAGSWVHRVAEIRARTRVAPAAGTGPNSTSGDDSSPKCGSSGLLRP